MAEHEKSVGETNDWFTPREILRRDWADVRFGSCSSRPRHPALPRASAAGAHARGRRPVAAVGRGSCIPELALRPAARTRSWLRKLIAHSNGIGLFRAYTSADWFHEALLPAKPC